MNLSFPMEPALWTGGVTAVIDLAIAFGVPITVDQKVAILGVVSAAAALIGAALVRSQVTPNAATGAPHA